MSDPIAEKKTNTVIAYKRLPPRWQTVLWYTEIEGLELAEAAVMMGMSTNSVAALAYRAREGLRMELSQVDVGPRAVRSTQRDAERDEPLARPSLVSRLPGMIDGRDG